MHNLNDAPTQEAAREQQRQHQQLTVVSFREFMAARGLNPLEVIEPGRLHRFPGEGDHTGTDGWCRLFEDEAGGVFGDWSTGMSETWQAKRDHPFTDDERRAFRRKCEESKRHIAEQREAEQQVAACQALERWERATPPANHQYLEKKRLAHGEIRQDGNRLLVPMFDRDGKLWALQAITEDGDKRYWPKGCRTAGCFLYLGDISAEPDASIHVVEGWATGAAIHDSTGHPVMVAFSAGNLAAVVDVTLQDCPGRKVVICADDDQKPDTDKNPGIEAARTAAKGKEDVFVALPTLGEKCDFWDIWDKQGAEAVRVAIARAERVVAGDFLDAPLDISSFMEKAPPPVQFFIQDRIPLARGVLITGLGGSSKTRLLYHLALAGILGRLPFDWQVERTGKAFLVLTEDIAEDVHRVLYAMGRGLNLTHAEKRRVVENLIIYPLAGTDIKLLVKTPTGTVEKSPLFHRVAEAIKRQGDVVFVGLDPALGLTEGDELDQNHQRSMGKMVDDLAIITRATVALVSHATKASQSQDEMTSHTSRGGGAVTDAVRAEYGVRNMTAKESAWAGIEDAEERKRHVQLVATKGNQLPPSAFVPIWLRRDDTGCLFGAEIQAEGCTKGTPSPRDLEILQVHTEISRFCTPTLADWRSKSVEKGLITGTSEEAKKQAMKRVCERLKKAGLIKPGIGKGVWVQVE